MDWRKSTVSIGDTKVYSEGSVEAIIEGLIADIDEMAHKDEIIRGRQKVISLASLCGYGGVLFQLKAKWLGKETNV